MQPQQAVIYQYDAHATWLQTYAQVHSNTHHSFNAVTVASAMVENLIIWDDIWNQRVKLRTSLNNQRSADVSRSKICKLGPALHGWDERRSSQVVSEA